MTPSQTIDKLIPAICVEESMDLFTTDLEKEGYQYPFLKHTGKLVCFIKPGDRQGAKSGYHRNYG